MKKIRLTALVMIFVFAFTLMGCAAGNDAEKEELEAKVEQLEQQVTDLQRSSGQEAPSPEEEATLLDNVQEDDNKEKSSSQAAASSTGDTLDTLETVVNDAVKEAEAAKPSGSASEKRERFFTLKHELESVEDRLDYYDDDIEMQYRQGELSLEDYRSQEHSLELLEDQLDRAEDTLEYTFGMDD